MRSSLDAVVPDAGRQPVGHAHVVRHEEYGKLPGRRRVIDVRRRRERHERAVARADEAQLPHLGGQLREPRALPLEPLGHGARLPAQELRGQRLAREALVVVARQVPRHERRVAAEPAAQHQHCGDRQRPARERDGRTPPCAARLANARGEPLGEIGCGQAREPRAERPLALGLGPAGRARLEMRGDRGRFGREKLAVDEPRDAFGLAAQSTRPASASRSSARPRWIRDMTVPTGTPMLSAISA